MTTPIFRHDNKPAAELGLDLAGPPILTSRRSPPLTPSRPMVPRAPAAGPQERSPRGTTDNHPFVARSALEVSIPPVVLQLPELVAEAEVTESRSVDLGNLATWVGISLGAVVAAVLIWTPPKSGQPEAEPPSTWHDAVPAPAAAAAPPNATAWQGNQDAAPQPAQWSAPAAAPPAGEYQAPSMPDNPPPPNIDRQPDPQADPPFSGQPQAPAAGTAQAPSAQQRVIEPPVLTARGGNTTWDGGGSRPAPGVATPTGTITNVTVPQ